MDAERTRENSLWGWLRKGLKPFKLLAHVSRVENVVETGYPDVEGCIKSRAFTVELKVAYEHERGRIEVKITREQAYFAHGRSRAGGRSFVLIRVADRHYLIPGAWAIWLLERKTKLTEALLVLYSACRPDDSPQRIWEKIIA